MKQDKNIESTHEGIAEIAKKLNYERIHSSYPVNLQSANFAFWKSLEKLPNKSIPTFAKELLEMFASFAENKDGAILSVDLFERDLYEKNSSKEKAIELGNGMAKEYAKRKAEFNFDFAVCLDSKYKLKLLDEEVLKGNGIAFVNCQEKEYDVLPNRMCTLDGRGIGMVIALNLPKLALEAENNRQQFLKAVKERMAEMEKLYGLKLETMNEKEYLKGNFRAENFRPAVSLYGLFETATMLAGNNDEKDILGIAESIVESIPENWIVYGLNNLPIENRFAERNFQGFGFELKSCGTAENYLAKSSILRKRFCYTMKANSQKELEQLMASNVKCIIL